MLLAVMAALGLGGVMERLPLPLVPLAVEKVAMVALAAEALVLASELVEVTEEQLELPEFLQLVEMLMGKKVAQDLLQVLVGSCFKKAIFQ